ncbi:Holliday junction resolvase RuvX [Luteococcus sp. Sow4_B9]|uniref:Holliday junction resolvase RuvX n=1 Tax=Luteococcus sp. Sow4_B9 TaxID=3438792 RepID=UPI003F952A0A
MASLTTSYGVLLALDWGKARIGVAACDAQRILAYPVETVQNTPKDPAQVMRRLRDLVAEYEPVELLLGLPVSLQGDEGIAAQAMREVAERLTQEFGDLRVTLVDERLTSATAHQRLAQAGKNSRQRRGMIDQMAAVAILEQALAEGSTTPTEES